MKQHRDTCTRCGKTEHSIRCVGGVCLECDMMMMTEHSIRSVERATDDLKCLYDVADWRPDTTSLADIEAGLKALAP